MVVGFDSGVIARERAIAEFWIGGGIAGGFQVLLVGTARDFGCVGGGGTGDGCRGIFQV